MQAVEELPLVFVNPLHLDVEQGIRIDGDAGVPLDDGGQTGLVPLLDMQKLVLKSRFAGELVQQFELIKIRDPVVADRSMNQIGEFRVALHQPAAWRDAVRLVVEAFRPEFVELGQQRLLDKFGVHRRDAVDRMAADDGQVAHADLAAGFLVNDRNAPQSLDIARPAVADLLQEAMIDFEDDLQVPRQNAFEQRDRPALQGFRQQCVVCVRAGLLRDFPGLIPLDSFLIDQEPHQLGDSHRRMRIIELYADSIRKFGDRAAGLFKAASQIADSACDQEVLLNQSQLFALCDCVGRVEHFRDCFGANFVLDGLLEIARVERGHVEVARCTGREQSQRVNRLPAVADDRQVVRNADDLLPVRPHRVVVSVDIPGVLNVTIERNRHRFVRSLDQPRSITGHPVVGRLTLHAAFDELPEQAVFVVDAVAVSRHAKRRERIEEARGQSAEAAVAQARIRFLISKAGEFKAESRQSRPRFFVQAEVSQVVFQRLADEEFHRQVIEPFGVAVLVSLFGFGDAVDQAFADGEGKRAQCVRRSRLAVRHADRVSQVIANRLPQTGAAGNRNFAVDRVRDTRCRRHGTPFRIVQTRRVARSDKNSRSLRLCCRVKRDISHGLGNLPPA